MISMTRAGIETARAYMGNHSVIRVGFVSAAGSFSLSDVGALVPTSGT